MEKDFSSSIPMLHVPAAAEKVFLFRSFLNCSNTFQFDGNRSWQRVYFHCSSARLGRFIRKIFTVDFIENGKIIFHVGEIDGNVDQIFPPRTRCLQNKFYILKNRMTLLFN